MKEIHFKLCIVMLLQKICMCRGTEDRGVKVDCVTVDKGMKVDCVTVDKGLKVDCVTSDSVMRK